MKKLKELSHKITYIIQEYPFVLLIAFATAVFFILAENTNDDFYGKIGFVCMLGISLTFALSILGQRLQKKYIFPPLGFLFLIGFYLYVFENTSRDIDLFQMIICAVTFLLSHLLVSFIAYYKNENETSFWEYNKTLFVNSILTALFTLVLTLGINLAVLAIEKLFQVNFPSRLYFYIFVFLGCFGSSIIFLLFTEKGLSSLEKPKEYPVVLKFFTQFILIPLLLIYGVILYGYLIKIILEWDLPRGWVSYLVIAYSLVGILALLLVHPLKEGSTKGWVQIFQRIFYYSLIPLIALLFTAIFRRVSDYGITENRYYIFLLAIWLTIITVYFIFRKKEHIAFIPKSLFVLGFLSLILPFFNVFATSERSQLNEFKEILKNEKMMENGTLNFTKEIPHTVVKELAEKVEFFQKRKKINLIKPIIGQKEQPTFDSIAKTRWFNQKEFYALFTNITSDNEQPSNASIYVNNFDNQIHSIKGFDYFYNNFSSLSYDTIVLENTQISLNHKHSLLQLEFDQEGKQTIYDLRPFVNKTLLKYTPNGIRHETQDTIYHEFNFQDYHFKILVQSINQNTYNDSLYYNVNGSLLIKKGNHD